MGLAPGGAMVAGGRVLGLLLVGALLAGGCTAERRYRTLSFFFDGVPDPNAPVEEAAAPEPTAPQVALVRPEREPEVAPGTVHPPFAERLCDACHTFESESRSKNILSVPIGQGVTRAQDQRMLAEPVEQLCFECHDDMSPEKADPGTYTHGPVAAGACVFCHNPHSSPNASLLRAASPRLLCLKCHQAQDLAANELHPPLEDLGDEDCTSCHNPHRSSSRYLL